MARLGFGYEASSGTENAQRQKRYYSVFELAGHTTQFKFTHPPDPGGYGLGLLTVPLILVYLGITLLRIASGKGSLPSG